MISLEGGLILWSGSGGDCVNLLRGMRSYYRVHAVN